MKCEELKLSPGKKVYFASDFHLGIDGAAKSSEREKQIVQWLESIRGDCEILFLVGDVFDFWFEYKHVAPKGFVRMLGKLAHMCDRGVEIIFYSGNHDLWYREYLKQEIGVKMYHHAASFQINDKRFYVTHGDGLDKKDVSYQFIKWMFNFPLFKWLFGWLHPTIGYTLARFWSGISRKTAGKLLHEEKIQLAYCEKVEKVYSHEFYVMGDSHNPNKVDLSTGAKFINLGDWLMHNSYATFDGDHVELQYFASSE